MSHHTNITCFVVIPYGGVRKKEWHKTIKAAHDYSVRLDGNRGLHPGIFGALQHGGGGAEALSTQAEFANELVDRYRKDRKLIGINRALEMHAIKWCLKLGLSKYRKQN
jgi:hypothetical protein